MKYEQPMSRLTLVRANQIIDRISEISSSGGYLRPVPLSKIGASSTIEVLRALYRVSAETFRTAYLNDSPQNRGILKNFITSAGGTGMWIAVMFRPDNKMNEVGEVDGSAQQLETINSFVEFLKTIDPASNDYWVKVSARIGLER